MSAAEERVEAARRESARAQEALNAARRTARLELELDAIRLRADAATAGPWKAIHDMDEDISFIGGSDPGYLHISDWDGEHYDAEFVAHAREDVPALLDRIAELEAVINKAADICYETGCHQYRTNPEFRSLLRTVRDAGGAQ